MKYIYYLPSKSLTALVSFFFITLSLSAAESAGELKAYNLLKSFSESGIKDFFKERKIPKMFLPAKAGVDVYEIIYNTTFANGDMIKASGLLYVPKSLGGEHPVLLYNHGTEICRETHFNGKGEQSVCLAFATDGYVVLCPDYIGVNKGEGQQLYLNAATEASSSVDMYQATTPLLKTFGTKISEQLFLSGYLQGGHATLATHKLIQEKYADKITVTASSPMSGPYNLEQTVYDGRNKRYAYPGYLMFLFHAYYGSQGDYTRMAEVLKSPYDKTVTPLMNGQWPMEVINASIPDTAFRSVKEEVLVDFEQNPNSPFRKYLSTNNVYDWKPEAPVQLCYCNGDKEVPYGNSTLAYVTMKKNGSSSVTLRNAGKKFNHYNCALFAVIYTKMYFDNFVKGKSGNHHHYFKHIVLDIGKLAIEP